MAGNDKFSAARDKSRHMIDISDRSSVEPFIAMDVLAEANRLKAAGKPVLSLVVGQPAAPAPKTVRDAAIEALHAGPLGYTDTLGRREARQAIADHYREHYGIEVPVERVAVTTGSSTAFSLAFLALAETGGRVAIVGGR